MIYIYTLEHPVTSEIRYVGKTNNLKERYKDHCNRKKKTHISKWVFSLRKEKLKPKIQVIDLVEDSEWEFWERYWISQMKTWGINLTNHKDGGTEGHYGNKTSFKKGHYGVKVVSFSMTGNKVAEFENCFVASKMIGVNTSSLSGAIKKRYKTAGGFIWLKKNEYDTITEKEFDVFVKWCNTIEPIPEEARKRQGKKMKGRVRSEEEIKKYLKTRELNDNYVCSEETKDKIRKKNLGVKPPNCCKIGKFDDTGTLIQEYDSIRVVVKGEFPSVARYVDKDKFDKNGFKWKKIK